MHYLPHQLLDHVLADGAVAGFWAKKSSISSTIYSGGQGALLTFFFFLTLIGPQRLGLIGPGGAGGREGRGGGGLGLGLGA